MEPIEYRPERQPLVAPGQIECHVRDMTATASAQMTLEQLQQELARRDQWLPIDGDPRQSVGTLVSCDSTGPLRLGYGAWRDLLLGVQFFNGRGELVTAGGRTVKNVAGYDLTKFMVGQRGVFGRLLTITTRTYRRPYASIATRFSPDPAILRRLIPTSLRPQWAIMSRDAMWCGYLGDQATIGFYRDALKAAEPGEILERSLEDDIAERSAHWTGAGRIAFRISVPPMNLPKLFAALPQISFAADAAFGVAVGAVEYERDLPFMRDAAIAADGTARFFDGPWGKPLELSTTPAQRRIIERLKLAFDPDSRLEPLPWQIS